MSKHSGWVDGLAAVLVDGGTIAGIGLYNPDSALI